MQHISATFSYDLDLRAGVTAIFCRVRTGENRQLRNRLLVGSDYGCTRLAQRVHAHAIDHVVVCAHALSVGADLYLILRLKNTPIGLSWSCTVGQPD